MHCCIILGTLISFEIFAYFAYFDLECQKIVLGTDIVYSIPVSHVTIQFVSGLTGMTGMVQYTNVASAY